MTRQRFRVAHVHHALEQAESVEALPAAFVAAFHAEGQQRAEVRSQIAMRHRIQRIIRKAGIVHPFHPGMAAQEFRHLARILHVPLYAQRQSLNSLQEQEIR